MLKKKVTRYDKICNNICPDCGRELTASNKNQICIYCGAFFETSFESTYVSGSLTDIHQPEGLTKEEADNLDDGIERHTIKEWGELKGPIVMDPDGFNRRDINLMSKLFTYGQFDIGTIFSTCKYTQADREKYFGMLEKD